MIGTRDNTGEPHTPIGGENAGTFGLMILVPGFANSESGGGEMQLDYVLLVTGAVAAMVAIFLMFYWQRKADR